MSSTFLYVGIVAIWAFFLVPRWLRRAHSAPRADENPAGEFTADPEDRYAEPAAEYAAAGESYSAPGEAYGDEVASSAEAYDAPDEAGGTYAAWPDRGQLVSQ